MADGRLLCLHAGYGWVLSAEWTSPILSKAKHPIIQVEGVIDQQTSPEGLSYIKDELEYFGGLDQANLPGHNAQDTNLTSGRDQPVSGGNGPDAA